jgi:serine/threonine protein kinase
MDIDGLRRINRPVLSLWSALPRRSSQRTSSHYRIVGPLGAGGMGEVYAARDEILGRSVALKILPLHPVRTRNGCAACHRGEVGLSLNHPNIVTITDRPGRACG